MGYLPYQLVQDFFHQQYDYETSFIRQGSSSFLKYNMPALPIISHFANLPQKEKSTPGNFRVNLQNLSRHEPEIP